MTDLVRALRFLARFSRDIPWSRTMIFIVLVAGLVGGLSTTGLLVVINSSLATGDGGVPSAAFDWRLYVGLCVAMTAFALLSDLILVRLSQKAVHQLRLRLARRVMGQSLSRLEQIGPERLLATLTNDVVALTDAFSTLPSLCLNLAIVFSCLGYLFWLAPAPALALVVAMAVGVVSYQLPVLRGVAYKLRARDETDELFYYLRGLTEGAKELKLSGRRRDGFVDRELHDVSDSLRRLHQTGDSIFAAVASWGRVLFFVLIGLTLFVAPELYGIGTDVVLAFSMALILMISPLDLILASLPRLGNAEASARKIEELGLTLGVEGEVDARSLPPASKSWKSLVLEGVRYAYPSRGDQLGFEIGPLDLAFAPGELVFLVGGNGSGKTTLAKILLGLYAPVEGRVLFDGQPLGDGERDRYRQHFSVVFSNPFVFRSLVADDDLTDVDAEARHHLERLELADKVRVRDGVLDTVELSQGQRKRLALLQALVEDRPLCLFDEWAAEQDPHFRRVFYEQLLPRLAREGKTVFVISHDDHYFGAADRVIKMSYGTVEYDGPPPELAPGALTVPAAEGSAV